MGVVIEPVGAHKFIDTHRDYRYNDLYGAGKSLDVGVRTELIRAC